jgi:cyclic-di-GMP phosphodiesterase TipF (flagellum assembly factor)
MQRARAVIRALSERMGMGFLGSAVVVTAMGVVSASAGAVGFLLFRFGVDTSVVFSLAVFGLLLASQAVRWRAADRADQSRGMDDVGRAVERLTRDVALVANRVAVLEASGVATARNDVMALREDLDAVRRGLAETHELARASHDGLSALAAPRAPEPLAPPALVEDARARPRLSGGAPDRSGEVMAALATGRMEVLLQPIVTLPQRKIRWYEVVARLKTERGDVLLADDIAPALADPTLAARFDAEVIERSIQLVKRLQARNREVGLVVDMAPASLAGAERFRDIVEALAGAATLSGSIVLEIPQMGYRRFGPIEHEAMSAIGAHGFRFSLDQTRDLRLDTRDLADRGFRFVKVPADVLLGRSGALPADIHPADLAGLLTRYGIDLVADRVETEATVVDLLDYDVRFGQGALFSPPRPVRPEVLGDVEPERRRVAGA